MGDKNEFEKYATKHAGISSMTCIVTTQRT